jgi:K+-transporting ATPase KdpF subunit
MSAADVLGLMVAVALMAFLLFALVRGERL